MPAGLLSVFRASVPPDLLRAADPELQAFYEGPSVARVEGLFAHWFGVSSKGEEATIVLVSGWESEDAATAFARANRLPCRTGRIAEIVALGTTERWDLVDQVVSTFEPSAATVMRITKLQVSPERLEAVIDELVAERAWVPGQSDVAASQLAARCAGDGAQVLVLTAWRDAVTLARMQTRVTTGWNAFAKRRGLTVTVDCFELRPSGLLRLTPRGPAVVITDDHGVIVDATPAAVGLLGRSVWDLFQLRFDDLPRHLEDGTALISRPEGGSIRVHVARSANMPAPGRHAALLIPAFEPAPVESSLEAAIAAAYRRGPTEPRPVPVSEPGGLSAAPLPASIPASSG